MRTWFGWRRVFACILLIETAYLTLPVLRNFTLRIEESQPARGRRVAASLGCFTCHGPEGRGNVPNRGSQLETVPGFTEQTLMMFVKNAAELREYILDGAPRRRRDDPTYQEKMAAQAIRMPAFRGWISDADLDALVAYLRLVSGFMRPKSELAARGEELAHSLGCFACHGELGMGGRANPGALKGYVPGFLGADFHDLVRNDDELMAWLRDGALPRIADHSLGHYFFNRQRIRMPAYKGHVAEADLQALAAYVHWLADGSWQSEPFL